MEEWARELHRKGAAERSQARPPASPFCRLTQQYLMLVCEHKSKTA